MIPSLMILDVDILGSKKQDKEAFRAIGLFAVHVVDKWS